MRQKVVHSRRGFLSWTGPAAAAGGLVQTVGFAGKSGNAQGASGAGPGKGAAPRRARTTSTKNCCTSSSMRNWRER